MYAKARDIDLGVKGLNPALFFKFYGELMRHLSKPVDVVDLAHRSLFNNLVEQKGVKIYGWRRYCFAGSAFKTTRSKSPRHLASF
jgi:hypothetical protein